MVTKACNLDWPDKMIDVFGGSIVPVSEQDFNHIRKHSQSLLLDDDTFRGLYEVYLQIAAWIDKGCEFNQHPAVIGINGAQGTGKSTAAFILRYILEYCYHKKVCVLSLDDIYLTRQERSDLARDVHPLLVTRGVPGTHDIEMGLNILKALKNAHADTKTRIPRFDKARDDRCRDDQWHEYTGKPDIVLLEGWCVSAIPQSADSLRQPLNQLERLNDHDCVWRDFVNNELERYQELFRNIEFLLMLKAPDYSQVYEWRLLQEEKLRKGISGRSEQTLALMDEEKIGWFIEHFERLTRWMLDEMSDRADLVLAINKDHRFSEVILNRGK